MAPLVAQSFEVCGLELVWRSDLGKTFRKLMVFCCFENKSACLSSAGHLNSHRPRSFHQTRLLTEDRVQACNHRAIGHVRCSLLLCPAAPPEPGLPGSGSASELRSAAFQELCACRGQPIDMPPLKSLASQFPPRWNAERTLATDEPQDMSASSLSCALRPPPGTRTPRFRIRFRAPHGLRPDNPQIVRAWPG